MDMNRDIVKKRRLSLVCSAVMALAVMCTFGGCGSSSNYATADVAAESAEVTWNQSTAGSFSSVGEVSLAAESADSDSKLSEGEKYLEQRKLIKTVDMQVETKEFDKALATFTETVEELGGYIESMDTYNGSYYYGYRSTRNADMTIRIPKDQLDVFTETVEGIANVTSRSDNVEDVTLTYVDLESHKEALRIEQTRLLELLEKAETIQDIITIESRLSEVRYQLESMESQLRTYDNKVDYSTVYLNIDEVEVLTPVDQETTWERITTGFMGSIEDIIDSFKEMVIAFLIYLPYFLILGIVVVIVIVVIRLCTRKSRKEQKNAAAPKSPEQTGTK